MTAAEAKALVVEAGHRLVEAGLVARTWGNVSCRIDGERFAVTPSGREYASLTPDDIVEVRIDDCSYSGAVKPSSEKGVHAAVYRLRPDVNFVIHTHQDAASVAGSLGLETVTADGGTSLLGTGVSCASYALPGTKKLTGNIARTLASSPAHALLMAHHGALCFGADCDEAFRAARELEKACETFLFDRYRNQGGEPAGGWKPYCRNALGLPPEETGHGDTGCAELGGWSERTAHGFVFHSPDGTSAEVDISSPAESLPKRVLIHREIYGKNDAVGAVVHASSPAAEAVSEARLTLRPYLDDFAQIAGTRVKTVEADPGSASEGLSRAQAVFLRGAGALCVGRTVGDARAVSSIVEKNCRAHVSTVLFGSGKPLGRIDCALMRFVYLTKYSKRAADRP